MSKIMNDIAASTALFNSSIGRIDKKLAKSYQKVAKNIIGECEKLYLQILESGNPLSYSEMMRYDRYFLLLAEINKQLQDMGQEQIKILNTEMIQLYLAVGSQIAENPSFAIINKAFAEEAVKRAWCQDGLLYSDRIWKNMNLLQSALQDELVNCVVTGASHERLSRTLRNRFDVSYSDAQRLARTELNYIQNQGALRGYEAAGYHYFQFITAVDNRMCDECGRLNNKIFPINEAKVGVNCPPIHPNCRSNIVGYRWEEN